MRSTVPELTVWYRWLVRRTNCMRTSLTRRRRSGIETRICSGMFMSRSRRSDRISFCGVAGDLIGERFVAVYELIVICLFLNDGNLMPFHRSHSSLSSVFRISSRILFLETKSFQRMNYWCELMKFWADYGDLNSCRHYDLLICSFSFQNGICSFKRFTYDLKCFKKHISF